MEYVKIKDICTFLPKSKIKAGEGLEKGEYIFFTSSDIKSQMINEYLFDEEAIILGTGGKPSCNYYNGKFSVSTDNFVLKSESINIKYLYYYLRHNKLNILEKGFHGAGLKHISKDYVKDILIPLCDNEKQNEIVENLDFINSIIGKCTSQLTYLETIVKSQFIEMFGDVINAPKYKGIKLKMLCRTISGGTPSTKYKEFYEGEIPWITTVQLGENFIDGSNPKAFITEDAINSSATHLIPKYNILFGTRVGVGKSSINTEPICINQDINAIVDIDKDKWNILFIKYVLDNYLPYFDSIKKGATILGITTDNLKNIDIPNVSIKLQNKFAAFAQQIDKSKYFEGNYKNRINN